MCMWSTPYIKGQSYAARGQPRMGRIFGTMRLESGKGPGNCHTETEPIVEKESNGIPYIVKVHIR